MPVLADWQLSLDVDSVLRGQGADPGAIRARSPRVVEAAERALRDAVPLLAPIVAYERLDVHDFRHERVVLEGGATLGGPLIAAHLKGARSVVAAVCTVGQAIDDVVSGTLEEDPLFGLALDGLGSAAVEALATSVSNRFEEEASAAGLETTIPLSPGMVGWPVERGQPELFAVVRPAEAGVRLTSTWMMSPRKSVSFVLGIGPDVRTSGRTCDYCSLKDTCRYQDHYAPENARV
jgi:hypothetical protein